MIGQVFRWLIFTALLAAALVAVFVAWWLALLIALVALALAGLRRLFGGRRDECTHDGTAILEGKFTEVGRDSHPPPDRDQVSP